MCIDGTHIGIITPGGNQTGFLNSKGYHSINVMLDCSKYFLKLAVKIINVFNFCPYYNQKKKVYFVFQ